MWLTGACYIRVSTDEQTEFSPDAQLKAIKDYAKKNNIILAKKLIFVDEGISGRKAEKRPAFMKMIAMAKTKPRPFDVILVHKFDRFARSREDSVVYKSLLKKEAGIKVVSVTESIENDKFSIILEAILEAMAEYYSINLSDEVLKGMTEKAERGGYQSGAPFGYKMVDKRLEIMPEEAEFIRFIFENFAQGTMNMLQLAKYANSIGVRTKRGNLFETRNIEYILNNPVYLGMARWTPTQKVRRNYNHPDSIVKKSDHLPLVSQDLWEKAQIRLQENKKIYGRKQRGSTSILHWSQGLVKCGNCGKSLVISQRNYYQCCGYTKGTCEISHCIKISKLEDLILQKIKQTFRREIELHILPKPDGEKNPEEMELDLLTNSLEKLKKREQRIKEAYQDGIDSLEEYKENRSLIERERKELLERISKLTISEPEEKSNGEETIQKIESAYDLLIDETIDIETKYKTAHFLIDKIVYQKTEKTLSLTYK